MAEDVHGIPTNSTDGNNFRQAAATVSSALTITHLRIFLAAFDPLDADTAAGVGDHRRVRRNRRCGDATRIDLLLNFGLPRHVARGAAS